MYRLTTRAAGTRSPQAARLLGKILSPELTQRIVRRECARIDRHGGELSLVLFRISTGDRRKDLAACRLARTILLRARETDEVGWFGEHFIAALLPDTSAAGAKAFADGIAHRLAHRVPRPLTLIFTYPKAWMAGPLPAGRFGELNSAESLDVTAVLQAVNLGLNRHSNGLPEEPAANGRLLSDSGRLVYEAAALPHSASNAKHSNGNGHPPANRNGNGHSNGAALARITETRPEAGMPTSILKEQPGLSLEALDDLLIMPMPRWKRLCDIVGATALLVATAPLLLVVAVLVKLNSRGSVIFTQRRAGLGGKPFTIYKFRTMVADAESQQQKLRSQNEQDGPAFKLTDDPRVTSFGRWLRKSSIDELPQLWNVIRGDMSLVGPRPLPIDESDACEPWQRRRLHVTPGLTCIWQVEGRSRVTFAEWVRMDVRYIRRRTLFHDFVILVRTVPAVLFRRGAR